jgi:hypothetical protein
VAGKLLWIRRRNEQRRSRKKLAEHIDKPLGFCPLIKDMCRADCVSYNKAYICKGVRDYWFVEESCTNPLVTG